MFEVAYRSARLMLSYRVFWTRQAIEKVGILTPSQSDYPATRLYGHQRDLP